jgi:hypothetical protein
MTDLTNHERIDVIWGYQCLPDNSNDPEIKTMWEDHYKFWDEIRLAQLRENKIDTIKDILIIMTLSFIFSCIIIPLFLLGFH